MSSVSISILSRYSGTYTHTRARAFLFVIYPRLELSHRGKWAEYQNWPPRLHTLMTGRYPGGPGLTTPAALKAREKSWEQKRKSGLKCKIFLWHCCWLDDTGGPQARTGEWPQRPKGGPLLTVSKETGPSVLEPQGLEFRQ